MQNILRNDLTLPEESRDQFLWKFSLRDNWRNPGVGMDNSYSLTFHAKRMQRREICE